MKEYEGMKNPFSNLTIRFSKFGLLIVAAQALPNVIWALCPPVPNRLEGIASSSLFIEYGEHILRVVIVIFLLFLGNKTKENKLFGGNFAVISYIAIALYWCCWILYFAGIQPNFIIYAMVALPTAAFICAGIAEKVWPIYTVGTLFLLFHLSVTAENFPIR